MTNNIPTSMTAFTFAQCREAFEIADGYADDNILYSDGALSELPTLKFIRHGNMARKISGCSFEIPSTTKGMMNFFCLLATHISVLEYRHGSLLTFGYGANQSSQSVAM